MGFPHAKDCYHLQYDFVELPDGAMSSRKGNIIPLQDLVDNMIELVENEHLHKYQETWTKEELEKVAHQVAVITSYSIHYTKLYDSLLKQMMLKIGLSSIWDLLKKVKTSSSMNYPRAMMPKKSIVI